MRMRAPGERRRSPRLAKGNQQVHLDATQKIEGQEAENSSCSTCTVNSLTRAAVAELQAQISQLQQTLNDHVARLEDFKEPVPNLQRDDVAAVYVGHSLCDLCLTCLLETKAPVCPVCRSKISRRPVAAYTLQDVIRSLLDVQPESVRSHARWEPAWKRLVAQSNAGRRLQDRSGAGYSGQPVVPSGEITGNTASGAAAQPTSSDGESNDDLLAYLIEYFHGRINL
ncbi:hypothetical protein BKA62DRAFT_675379 [Auriculariales sp. MPI-PUGE-AT-0066]|nr:hypothetical protein BKA62DRAFT_675379 [Auriculariales sp. MPI-PUGE-AT-0066]